MLFNLDEVTIESLEVAKKTRMQPINLSYLCSFAYCKKNIPKFKPGSTEAGEPGYELVPKDLLNKLFNRYSCVAVLSRDQFLVQFVQFLRTSPNF